MMVESMADRTDEMWAGMLIDQWGTMSAEDSVVQLVGHWAGHLVYLKAVHWVDLKAGLKVWMMVELWVEHLSLIHI